MGGLMGGLQTARTMIGSIDIPFLQGGGAVSETGLAVVHAGEQVLPADQTQALAGMLGPAGGGGGAGGGADYSVHLEGVSINIQAGNVDAGSAQQLSDEIVRHLQEKLGALRAEQEFRTGTRASAPA
jgi:hypothetical protein